MSCQTSTHLMREIHVVWTPRILLELCIICIYQHTHTHTHTHKDHLTCSNCVTYMVATLRDHMTVSPRHGNLTIRGTLTHTGTHHLMPHTMSTCESLSSDFMYTPNPTSWFVLMNSHLQIIRYIQQTLYNTVELLIKDTPNKGHLSIKDTCFDPMYNLTLNKGHLCIKDNFYGPSVSFIYTEVPLYVHVYGLSKVCCTVKYTLAYLCIYFADLTKAVDKEVLLNMRTSVQFQECPHGVRWGGRKLVQLPLSPSPLYCSPWG